MEESYENALQRRIPIKMKDKFNSPAMPHESKFYDSKSNISTRWANYESYKFLDTDWVFFKINSPKYTKNQ